MAIEKKQNNGVVFSFDPNQPEVKDKKPKSKGPLDTRFLKEAKEFSVVFNDGKAIKAKLLEIDAFNIVVESGSNNTKLLIPKHAIKYVIL